MWIFCSFFQFYAPTDCYYNNISSMWWKYSSTKRYISYPFSTSSYNFTSFISFVYLTQIHSLFSDHILSAEIWLVSYMPLLPLDFFFISIMEDSRTICNRTIFLAYFSTFFFLMITLEEAHFFLSAQKTHYFFIFHHT